MTEKVKFDTRRVVGEDIYQELFENKEMEKKTGDKRSSSSTNQPEMKKEKIDQLIRNCGLIQSSSGQEEAHVKKTDSKITCKPCGKFFTRTNALYRHRRHHCKERLPTLKLEWNGESWVKSNHRSYYRLQLGRNLFNLIEKGAIKADVFNSTQKEYVEMYKKLFTD